MSEGPRLVVAGVLLMVAGLGACRSSPPPDQLFAEAEHLRLAYERSAGHEAAARYGEAADAWLRLHDPRQAAVARQRVGQTYEQLGLLQESLRGYDEALSLALHAGDPLLESDVRSDVGVVRALAADRQEELEAARRDCDLALAIAVRLDSGRERAKALNCLGEAAYSRGDREDALAFYREAQTFWDRDGDRRGQAETLLFQGYVYSDQSDLDRAQACFTRAMSLWTALGDARGVAITLVAEAWLQQRRGEFQEALNRFGEAQARLQRMGDAVWEAASLTGLGSVYLHMAEPAFALKYWEQALAHLEAAGLKSHSVDVLMSLGETYLASGDDASALDRFERALSLGAQLGNQRWQAYALRFIGKVHAFRHRPAEAIQYFERSLDAQREFVDPRFEALTTADLGDAHEMLGDHDLAVASFRRALDLSRAAWDRAGEASDLYGLARTSVTLGDLRAARTYIEQSLSVTEQLRSAVESRDMRASFVASVHPYYELHVDVLMRLSERRHDAGLAAEAFAASERARARSLLDSLADAGVDLRAGVEPALLGQLDALDEAFDDWARRHRARGDAPDLQAEYRDLEERYDRIQSEIRQKSPRYAALVHPRPLDLAAVQQEVLDDDTLLLEYSLGDQRSYLWAVSRGGQSSYELPPRADIERAARRVFELLTARLTVAGDLRDRQRQIEAADAEYWIEAGRLSEILLGPVAGKMSGKRLLVVADGALQYLPFAALPLPRHGDEPVPMVVEHEIVHLPSASVLAVVRRDAEGRLPPAGIVAVLADPVFERDDPRLPTDPDARVRRRSKREGSLDVPRLPATRREAQAIAAIMPRGSVLEKTDFDASRSLVMSGELAQYGIVHFATHGIFDNEAPGLSGIVLSMFDAQGRPQDGFLRLHDIYGLRLPVELVVLSACNTALGRQLRGEGLAGVVRGFMYAGASRVVASLWKVDDEATGELMTRFYRHMLRERRSAASALRLAQLDVWRTSPWQPPYYWAAFVLQGEWR